MPATVGTPPRRLLVLDASTRAGLGGHPADVDDRGAGGEHLARRGRRAGGRVRVPAVVERIRGDVDDRRWPAGGRPGRRSSGAKSQAHCACNLDSREQEFDTRTGVRYTHRTHVREATMRRIITLVAAAICSGALVLSVASPSAGASKPRHYNVHPRRQPVGDRRGEVPGRRTPARRCSRSSRPTTSAASRSPSGRTWCCRERGRGLPGGVARGAVRAGRRPAARGAVAAAGRGRRGPARCAPARGVPGTGTCRDGRAASDRRSGAGT